MRYTTVELSVSDQKINSDSTILTIGSCFSDAIGRRLSSLKFDCIANPLGILYNPFSIANGWKYLSENKALDDTLFDQNGEVYFHYDFHSQFSTLEKLTLIDHLNEAIMVGRKQAESADWVIITLGTSICHRLRRTGQIVSNCHKQPAHYFDKSMLAISESIHALRSVVEEHSANIILTVSPIRHIKEGLVQNQRSKARLIEVAHILEEQYSHVTYFPSYEIMIDELRGYRYYDRDLIHPSKEAIDFIWDRFLATYFSEDAYEKAVAVGRINKALKHKPFLPESKAHQTFLMSLLEKMQQVSVRYKIDYRVEVEKVRTQLI